MMFERERRTRIRGCADICLMKETPVPPSTKEKAKYSDLANAVMAWRQQPLNATMIIVSLMGAFDSQSSKELRKTLGWSSREIGASQVHSKFGEAEEEAVIQQERTDAIQINESEGAKKLKESPRVGEVWKRSQERRERDERRPHDRNEARVEIRREEYGEERETSA
jgi:hypothetical protein